MSLHFPLPKIRTFCFSLHTSRLSLHGEVTWRWNSQLVHTFHSQKLFRPLSVREREIQRDRERRKWRHHCRAKIGDEFALSLAKNSHNWRWVHTFPCQKIALFVSPFTLPVSPLWRWSSHFPLPKNSPSLFRLSLQWHEPRDEWSKTQDKWPNSVQSCCSSHRKNESN